MRHAPAVIIASFAVLIAACSVAPPNQSPMMARQQHVDLTVDAEQLRVRVRAMVTPLSGHIIEGSRQLAAASDDYTVRREALVFKIAAIPALRDALFRQDPLTAIGDTWAFAGGLLAIRWLRRSPS